VKYSLAYLTGVILGCLLILNLSLGTTINYWAAGINGIVIIALGSSVVLCERKEGQDEVG